MTHHTLAATTSDALVLIGLASYLDVAGGPALDVVALVLLREQLQGTAEHDDL